ncbi:hypothetical protein [Actinoplanes derwentensis]|uniref:Uncharacterized protein n=1 Tax=Actinoplanes derwentensis TaxID=113562 RepID=A0A1H2DF51_9ACTN|nr:hypothetical protein [Actinoplanes derwentensis]GID84775.1 hypothetical protein Ade03nite_36990 [Actinoplanes derwentensis]SDT81122.1 hypothetical protein SAMN04489716_9504 [Actinoplanes derwentensis]
MAVIFELVVNFGQDVAGAERAREAALAAAPLVAGAHRIGVHAHVDTRGAYAELSVMPVAVSWGSTFDEGLPHLELSAAELTELGHGLYGLLSTFSGYRAAAVGWDCEPYADTEDLEDAEAPGRVFAEGIVSGPSFTPFAPGYVWVPYTGENWSPAAFG